MILVKNRTLLFSNREQYLGTVYDEKTAVRVFCIPRVTGDGVDIAHLTFVMNVEKGDDSKVSIHLTKEVREDEIILIWQITNEVLNPAGTMFVSIHATDAGAKVRWSTFLAPVYSEGTADAPDASGDAVAGFEQLVAKAEDLYTEMSVNEQTRDAAESERQTAEAKREEADALREARTNEVIQTFENAINEAEENAETAKESVAIAKNEANRASMYADFVEPDFILQDNRVYINKNSTVEFVVSNNRLCFKLPA